MSPLLANCPANRIDPITVEVIGSALSSIVEEMGEALVRASFSTNIKERRDCSTALFDTRGTMLCQAEHIPMHLGSFIGIIPEILKRHPVETMQPGDVFIGNDAYAAAAPTCPTSCSASRSSSMATSSPGPLIPRTTPISPTAAMPTSTRRGCGSRQSDSIAPANCRATCRS
jgi:hypothetical protein